jgi:uncharacterized cupin superfamily protein
MSETEPGEIQFTDYTRVNLFEVETEEPEEERPDGYRRKLVRIGPLIGAEQMGMTVYELEKGQAICPYHYEVGREEWLFVLSGRPSLRDPDDEFELEPGDVYFFSEDEDGAHKVTNHRDEVARVAMLSNKDNPSIAIYPDSGKIGFYPDRKLFRLTDEVDYFDGET